MESFGTWQSATIEGNSVDLDTTLYADGIVWRSDIDLPDVADTILFRLTVMDADTGLSDTLQVLLDNVVPSILLDDVLGEQTGDVTIHYQISNDGLTVVGLLCEYSLDSGVNWDSAFVIGDMEGIFSEGYSDSLIWFSEMQVPGIDLSTVRFRITPYDSVQSQGDGNGSSGKQAGSGVSLGMLRVPGWKSNTSANDKRYKSIKSLLQQESLRGRVESSRQVGIGVKRGNMVSLGQDRSVSQEVTRLPQHSHRFTQEMPRNDMPKKGFGHSGQPSRIAVKSQGVNLERRLGIPDETEDFHLDNNELPSIILEDIVGFQTRDITFNYMLSDAENDTLSILMEYQFDGIWHIATLAGDTFGIVQEEYAGTVVWHSLEDLPTVSDNILVRFIPFDNDEGVSEAITIQLDNIASSIQLIDLEGEQSGDVVINYEISNDEFSTVDLHAEYSINSGGTWTLAMVSGDTSDIDTTLYEGSLTWHSAMDLPGLDLHTVRFRITPRDVIIGLADETPDFHLDNNLIPTALITEYPDTGSVEMQINFILSDDENDTLSISGFFSVDQGQTWTGATLSGKISGLIQQDYSGTITWLLLQDVGFRRLSNVLFIMTPFDNDTGIADTSGYMTILNYPADFTGDLIIDPNDLALFAAAWNAVPQDTFYEIGPATGEVPELIPKPDGVFDFEDLMVFIQMWNWSFAHNGFRGGSLLLSKSASEPGSITLVQRIPDDPWRSDGLVTVDLFVNVNDDLMMVDGVFSFVRNDLELKEISSGVYLRHVFHSAPFFQQVNPDSNAVLFASVGFERTDKPFDETLPVATIRFKSNSTGESNIILDYNLRNLNGKIVESGQFNLTIDNLLPRRFVLHQNYPNPFNPITKIRYEIPKPAHVKLVIFDLLGREVVTLMNKDVEPGYYETYWNGKNSQGNNVSSGLYFYTIKAGDFIINKKMILLR